MNHYTDLYGKAVIYAINFFIDEMDHYMHLYGSTVINANHIKGMVNLMLKAHVKYRFISQLIVNKSIIPLTC